MKSGWLLSSTVVATVSPDLEHALGELFQLFFLGCVFLGFDLVFVLISAIVLMRRRSAVTLFACGSGNVLAALGFADFAVRFHNAVPLFIAAVLQLIFALFLLRQGRRLQASGTTAPSPDEPPGPAGGSLTDESR
jgi:hypothetical protein